MACSPLAPRRATGAADHGRRRETAAPDERRQRARRSRRRPRSARPSRSRPPLSFAPLRFADLTAFYRQFRRERFEFRRVLVWIHSALQQLQRFDSALERLALGIERAHLFIGRRSLVPCRAQAQDRRRLTVLRLGTGLHAAFAIAVVVEQRML